MQPQTGWPTSWASGWATPSGCERGDERKVSNDTRIEVVTEGILTRQLQRDPDLDGVSLVIFDEVHERNLQTDLALALCLDVRSSIRPDLRLLAHVGHRRWATIRGACWVATIRHERRECRWS